MHQDRVLRGEEESLVAAERGGKPEEGFAE
jgi:hypothetical protein